MLLAHAVTLAAARPHVAALADHALTTEGSSAYEHVLLELDWIHGGEGPALDTFGLTEDRDILHAIATSAIEELLSYGIDGLQVELVLAMLDDARALDES